MSRYCPDCGGRLVVETSPGGISKQVCESCDHGHSEVFTGP